MGLQNRVDPFGKLIRTPARGQWMGNRGLIHNERQEIVRPFRLKAWITCVLSFKGRHRPVMAPGQYTELFFFDEATAFAAGHRPCFECRREDALRFKQCWIAGNPEYGFTMKTMIGEIDEILQRERVDLRGEKLRFAGSFGELVNGVFIEVDGAAWVVWGGLGYRWTPEGYVKPGVRFWGEVVVLTPKSMVNAFRAGYVPQVGLGSTGG